MHVWLSLVSVSIAFVLRLEIDPTSAFYDNQYWTVDGVAPNRNFEDGESIFGPTLVLLRGSSYEFEADHDIVLTKVSPYYSYECVDYGESNNRSDVRPECFVYGVNDIMPARQLTFHVPDNSPDLLFYSNRDGSIWGYLYIAGGLPYFRYFFPVLIAWFGCLLFELRVVYNKGLTGCGPRWPRRVGYATPCVAWTSRAHTVYITIQIIVEVFTTIFAGCYWWVQIPLLFIQLYLLYATVTCNRSLVLWCPVLSFMTLVYFPVFAFGIANIMYDEYNGYQPTMTQRFYIPAVIISILQAFGFIFSTIMFCVMRTVRAPRRLDYVQPPPTELDGPPPSYALAITQEERPATPPLLVRCSNCRTVQGVLPSFQVVQCSKCFAMLVTPGANAAEGKAIGLPPPEMDYNGEGAETCRCCSAGVCSLACYLICVLFTLAAIGVIIAFVFVLVNPGFGK